MGRIAEWQKQGLDEPTPETNKYQVQILSERNKVITRMIAHGMSNTEIAEILGISPQMVCYVRNSAITARMVNELSEEADEATRQSLKEIALMSPDATRVLYNMMNNEEAPLSLQLKAATEILDRGGVARVSRVEGKVSHGHFRPEDILALKERALKEVQILEVEAEEVEETVQ